MLTVAIDSHGIFHPTMEVNGYRQLSGSQHSSNFLLLCSTQETNSYRFVKALRWINNDRINIFMWTVPFKHLNFCLNPSGLRWISVSRAVMKCLFLVGLYGFISRALTGCLSLNRMSQRLQMDPLPISHGCNGMSTGTRAATTDFIKARRMTASADKS